MLSQIQVNASIGSQAIAVQQLLIADYVSAAPCRTGTDYGGDAGTGEAGANGAEGTYFDIGVVNGSIAGYRYGLPGPNYNGTETDVGDVFSASCRSL